MSSIDSRHLDPTVVQQLGRLDLIAKVIANGLRQGMHGSRRRGFSTEFSDFNPYTPGDDLRFLDWRLFARTDRLYVKSFQAETNLEVMLLLDATRSMAWRWQATISKLEYAVNLLAAIAYVHIRQHDLVGLLMHDARTVHYLKPRSRRNQLDAIYATLDSVEPGRQESFPALIESLASYRRHRGRILLCSDLEEEPARIAEALERLSGHQDELILVHLLDRAEVELPFGNITHLQDSETGDLLQVNLPALRKQHARQLADFRGYWRDQAASWGIHYLPLDTADSYVDAIHGLLELLSAER